MHGESGEVAIDAAVLTPDRYSSLPQADAKLPNCGGTSPRVAYSVRESQQTTALSTVLLWEVRGSLSCPHKASCAAFSS